MPYRRQAERPTEEPDLHDVSAFARAARDRRRRAVLGVAGFALAFVVAVPLGFVVDEATRDPVMHCHDVTTVYENAPQLPPEVRQICVWR